MEETEKEIECNPTEHYYVQATIQYTTAELRVSKPIILFCKNCGKSKTIATLGSV